MKLISSAQQARVRFRFEVTASAIMATILVCAIVAINTPGYGAVVQQILAA